MTLVISCISMTTALSGLWAAPNVSPRSPGRWFRWRRPKNSSNGLGLGNITRCSVSDARKGEELILLTDYSDARLHALLERVRAEGVSAITVPKKILITRSIPLLANGKVDYVAARMLAQQILAGKAEQTTEQ